MELCPECKNRMDLVGEIGKQTQMFDSAGQMVGIRSSELYQCHRCKLVTIT